MGRMTSPPRFDFPRQTLAMGCAVLIFALGLFTASPALHNQLHPGPHSSLDDGCAVALFANGVSVSVGVIALPPVMGEWRDLPGVASREVFLDSPRYLLQPERGPPVG
ncbi:MAG TPA: hypothetical protein VKC51_06750 [Lacunisphaera sp.]|nr:hypothetical protein [Lacunisphaera sp.]